MPPGRSSPWDSQESRDTLRAEIEELRAARDRLRAVEHRLREQNVALVELSRNVSIAAGDLPAAMAAITETAARTLRVERVGVWFFDKPRTAINCVELYERGPNVHESGGTLTATDHPRYFAALEKGRTVAAHEAMSDPRTSEFADDYLRSRGITSMLDAPIRRGAEVAGIVCHEHVGPPRTWTPEDEAFAGSIADFVAMTLQAADRREAEATLGREQNVSSEIIDSLPGVFYLFDENGRYLRWNRNLERVSGYTTEEMADRHPLDFIPEEEREIVAGRIARVFERGWSSVESDLLAKDGTRTPYFFTGALLEVDGRRCLAGMGVDISERKRAEEAVRDSERRLRQVLDINPALIFAKDRAGRFTLVNRSLADIFGTTVDEMIGKTDADFDSNPEEVEFFRRIDLEVMNSLREHRIPEERITDVHGNVHWLQTVKRPIVNADGVADQVLGVCTDITERKRWEERQALMLRELDHRVKNNLAAVLSVAEETVLRSRDLDGFAEAFRGRIHAMAIAHEMLARTRWEGAEMRSMVERITRPYGGATRVHVSGPATIIPVEVAPSFAMVLHELTTNAIKHGALSVSEGQVVIDWRTARDPSGRDRLTMRWAESGGPAVAPPGTRGFGTEFIDEVITYQLHGSVELTFDEAGLRCQLEVPLARNESPDHHDGRAQR